VLDMIKISRQRSQTQLVHVLFIAKCSLKLTTFFGLSSIRPSSGHKSLIEETIQYMLQYLNQFVVVQRDLVFRPYIIITTYFFTYWTICRLYQL